MFLLLHQFDDVKTPYLVNAASIDMIESYENYDKVGAKIHFYRVPSEIKGENEKILYVDESMEKITSLLQKLNLLHHGGKH